MPTDIFADGSPRYDHGHDPATGETWWARDDATAGSVRRCPACLHEHPVLTTCLECEPCRALDLTSEALAAFADLLPEGAEAVAALLRHNRNLGLHASCDGSCGLADCRQPYFDEAGLTRSRDGLASLGPALPIRSVLVDLPVADDYQASVWEVDGWMDAERHSAATDASTTEQVSIGEPHPDPGHRGLGVGLDAVSVAIDPQPCEPINDLVSGRAERWRPA